jgi:hypothetical protein
MARFYFNLFECGTLIPDDEGRECDASSLRSIAIHEARDLMSGEVKAGRLCVGCRIDVLDEAGSLVLSVPFTDALEITGL